MKWGIGSAVALVLVAVLYWGWTYYRHEAKYAHVEQLSNDLMDSEKRKQMTPDERREKFRELRTEAEKLDEDQQRRLWQNNPMQKQIDEYFALPPEQRVAFLDRQIDEWERMRKSGEWPFGGRGRGGGPGAGGGGSPMGGGTPSVAKSSDGGGDSNRRSEWRSNPEKREQFRREMLNRTSPEQRAQWSEYFNSLQERRKQRGIR